MRRFYLKVIVIVATCSISIGVLALLLSSSRSLYLLEVQGKDMEPSLYEGDLILVTKRIEELRRGDIVTFRYPGDPSKSFIKRVVGLPGEIIEIRGGKVLLNGQYLQEDYLDSALNSFPHNAIPKRIPTGQYYMMGDNRDNSNDSRAWGALPQELLQGRLLFHF